MTVNAQDIELLELYLDHELSDADARSLDQRLASDASLQTALDRLRSHRSLRSAAMSESFDSDAASIERLVASVRAAQESEEHEEVAMSRATAAIATKRKLFSPVRSIFAAAACVAFGLILGVAIQRQQTPDGLVATPSMNSTSSFLNSSYNLQGHGAYVVSLINGEGREVVKVHFPSEEHARQFMEGFNKQNVNGKTPTIGDATVLQEEPY